jgi:DNA-binding MarR family transcriptional regulator
MPRSSHAEDEAELFKLSHSVSHLLHRAAQMANDRFTQLVGDSVTLRQFEVLAAIQEHPGLSQSELVRLTGVDRSTLADMLNRMERRTWITRAEAPLDARALAVRLAPNGMAILKATAPHALAANAAILDILPRTNARTLYSTLAKLSKLADKAAKKAERDAKRLAKKERREGKEREKKEREKKDAKPNGRRKREALR